MLLFATGTTLGAGTQSMMFLEPTAGVNTNSVAAGNGCGILDFQADITTPTPVNIPIAGPWVVDWSQLQHDGLGNPVVPQEIDGLLVGYYAGATVATLQTNILNLETSATSLYQAAIPGGQKYMNLDSASIDGGLVFSGFTGLIGTGVWAIGLLCSSCEVPAPIAVAILNPS
jgi:hypothetical protein